MHFKVIVNKDFKDSITFKFAKNLFRKEVVKDKNGVAKGVIFLFKNESVKEKEFEDLNKENIILYFCDLAGNKKFMTELNFDKEASRPFFPEKMVEENGALKILNANVFSLSKAIYQYIYINNEGVVKIEDIPENFRDLRKSTNLYNGNKEMWMNQNLIKLNTQYIKDYTLEFGIEYDAIDMNKPKNNYIKITKNDVIPVKVYIYPFTTNEEYKFIEDSNYFIRTLGKDDYLGEFINNEIKLTKINPNGFVRPETILNYTKLSQTKDKFFFVYENNKNQFVVCEVTK